MAPRNRVSEESVRLFANLASQFSALTRRDDVGRAAALDSLLDNIDVVVFAVSHSADLVYLNAAWERLFNVLTAQAIATNLRDYIHPRDRAPVLNYLADPNRNADGLIARWLTSDGRCLRLEMRVHALVAESGRPGYVGTLADVTQRMQADDLRQANHRTLETLIHHLPGMVYRCRNNQDWTMEFVSQGAIALTGYQPEDLINNRRLPYADLIVDADRQQVWDAVQASLAERRPFELTYRIRTAQGTEKWVLERGQGNFASSGELLGLEGFITELPGKDPNN